MQNSVKISCQIKKLSKQEIEFDRYSGPITAVPANMQLFAEKEAIKIHFTSSNLPFDGFLK